MGQEEAPPFGSKADPLAGAGEKTYHRAAEGAFQHVHLVEPAGAQLPDEAELLPQRLVGGAAVSVDGRGVPEDQLVNVGYPLDHLGRPRRHDPGYIGVRLGVAQVAQERNGQDGVPYEPVAQHQYSFSHLLLSHEPAAASYSRFLHQPCRCAGHCGQNISASARSSTGIPSRTG